MTVEHHQNCTGLRQPLWGGRQVEVWFCPAGAVIRPHVHHTLHSFIVCLWGRMLWTVRDRSREVVGPFRLRESNGRLALAAAFIPAFVRHVAKAWTFSIFLNLEVQSSKFKVQSSLPSAAQDFHPVP